MVTGDTLGERQPGLSWGRCGRESPAPQSQQWRFPGKDLSPCIITLPSPLTLWNRYYCSPAATGEEAEAQRGAVTSLRQCRWWLRTTVQTGWSDWRATMRQSTSLPLWILRLILFRNSRQDAPGEEGQGWESEGSGDSCLSHRRGDILCSFSNADLVILDPAQTARPVGQNGQGIKVRSSEMTTV